MTFLEEFSALIKKYDVELVGRSFDGFSTSSDYVEILYREDTKCKRFVFDREGHCKLLGVEYETYP